MAPGSLQVRPDPGRARSRFVSQNPSAPKRARSKAFVEVVGVPDFIFVRIWVGRRMFESDPFYKSQKSALRAARDIAAELGLEVRE